MGHEDIVMLVSIASSVLLQFSNALPNVPSWLPAVVAGLYKYSVDLSRERAGNNNVKASNNECEACGCGKVKIRAGMVEIETDKLEVDIT